VPVDDFLKMREITFQARLMNDLLEPVVSENSITLETQVFGGRFYTRLSQRALFRLPSRPVNVRVGPFVWVPE
jgi:hypothetical protein